MARPLRILMAKAGLDGHDIGSRLLTKTLRDAGHEVIYTGIRQTPAQIVAAAVQEDVDVVGLSILSGAHMSLTRKVLEGLRKAGAQDKAVVVGGILYPGDDEKLRGEGVDAVFSNTTSIPEILDYFKKKAEGLGGGRKGAA